MDDQLLASLTPRVSGLLTPRPPPGMPGVRLQPQWHAQQPRWQMKLLDPPLKRHSKRLLRDAGMSTSASEVDSVVFGHDIDYSDANVDDVRQAPAFLHAQGATSRQLASLRDIRNRRNCETIANWQPLPQDTTQTQGYVSPRARRYQSDEPMCSQMYPSYDNVQYDNMSPPPLHERQPAPYELEAALTRQSKKGIGFRSNASEVDEVVFGVDQDHSEATRFKEDLRASRAFEGAQGMTSLQLSNVR